MIEVRRIETGMGKFMVRGTKKDGEIPRIMSACLMVALKEYAEGKLRPYSIKDRFKPTGLSSYGMTRRTGKYMQRQRRAMGAVTPYVSPKRRSFLRTGMALGRGNSLGAVMALAKELAASSGRHDRDTVRTPGAGYVVRASGTRRIRVQITYPGMRNLNRVKGPNAAAYRKEFPDLSRGGGRDWKAIQARVADLYHKALIEIGRAA